METARRQHLIRWGGHAHGADRVPWPEHWLAALAQVTETVPSSGARVCVLGGGDAVGRAGCVLTLCGSRIRRASE